MKNFTFLFFLLFALVINAQQTTVILDFESPAKSANFQYFGSSLEPTLTQVVDNPIKSGINTSAKVSNFKKAKGGQTYQGAFSVSLPSEINVINGGQVCLKALFRQTPKNITLKLEGSSTGGPNWVGTVLSASAVDTWQEYCFDISKNSLEAPLQPAVGHSYKTLTLFFDFNDVPTVDQNFFFDDVLVKTNASTNQTVTFQVNTKGVPAPVNSVFVNGSFNKWIPQRLTKNAADSTWKGTFSIPTGNYLYQFTLDSPATKKEIFNGFETCTKNDTTRKEIYRTLTVARDSTYPVVCYNSCYSCGGAVKITVNLGTKNITVNPTGVYIAGGGNFGVPGDFPLTKSADGIYSITVERAKGFQSFYDFANGKCPDFSCKENIAGQSCAIATNYNDRSMGPLAADTTINTCFGICSTTNTACAASSDSVNVVFRVDMSKYTVPYKQVYVSGTLNNWAGDANPMTAPTATDKFWKTTIKVLKNTDYEFKFTLDNWANQENFTVTQAACTRVDPSGQFRNRLVKVTGDSTLTTYCFNACTACSSVGTSDLQFTDNLFRIRPSLANDYFVVETSSDAKNSAVLQVYNLLGKSVYTSTMNDSQRQQTISTQNLSNGLYFVSMKIGNLTQTSKVTIQH